MRNYFHFEKLYEMQISLHCLMFIAGKDMARPTLQGGRVGIVKWWLFWRQTDNVRSESFKMSVFQLVIIS